MQLIHWVESTLTYFQHAHLLLTAEEKADLRQLLRMLRPFANCIRTMEGEQYVTLSSYIPTILGLGVFLCEKPLSSRLPDWRQASVRVNAVREKLLEEMEVPGIFFLICKLRSELMLTL